MKSEKSLYLAHLAERCDRFKDMVQFLEDILKKGDIDLNANQRDLLFTGYKKSRLEIKNALVTVMAYEAKEKKKEHSNYLPFIIEYKNQLINELIKLCQGVLKTADNQLLKKSNDNDAKLFYLKMKGDYNRYVAEYADGDLKKQVSNDALKAYEKAAEIVKTFPVLNPNALALTLNFAYFYYYILDDHKKAIEIAQNAVDKVNEKFSNIDEDDGNIYLFCIYNNLIEYLDEWVKEENGEHN